MESLNVPREYSIQTMRKNSNLTLTILGMFSRLGPKEVLAIVFVNVSMFILFALLSHSASTLLISSGDSIPVEQLHESREIIRLVSRDARVSSEHHGFAAHRELALYSNAKKTTVLNKSKHSGDQVSIGQKFV